MTTTAPSTDAPRLTDGDTLREAIAAGIEEQTDTVGWDPEQVDMLITDFLAAAMPHLRAWYELAIPEGWMLRSIICPDPDRPTLPRKPVASLWSVKGDYEVLSRTGDTWQDALRAAIADATPPVEGRGVK